MKHLYLALNWVFGILFLLSGIFLLVELPLAGLCLIATSALLLPILRDFVYSKTRTPLPSNARAVSVIILLVAFAVFVGQAQERKAQELAAQQAREEAERSAQLQQKTIDRFHANREQIISSIRSALRRKDYQSTISQSDKYLASGDKELQQLNDQAKKELAAAEKAERTAKLLSELKRVPTKEYERNRNLYQQLLDLHPGNEHYKTKVAFYAGKIEEEKQKRIAAAEREKKIELQFSAWDGSHRNLERLIKEYMNDPDSYDHVETVYWDRGDHLVVRTTFRGKNAFGGVVRNTVKAKVTLDGHVIQILKQH